MSKKKIYIILSSIFVILVAFTAYNIVSYYRLAEKNGDLQKEVSSKKVAQNDSKNQLDVLNEQLVALQEQKKDKVEELRKWEERCKKVLGE